MSVLIKGMEMPKKYPVTVTIFPDGQVLSETVGAKDIHGTAVPVPPHGRLIDANSKTFPTLHRNPSNDYMKGWNAYLRSVQQQPTIIEAEEGE